MAKLRGHDLGCTLPAGWDGRISVRHDGAPEAFGVEGGQPIFTAIPQPVVHLANFALPEERGDFGSGAVELMGTRDVLIVLFEYEPGATAQPLFTTQGIPAPSRRATSIRRCCGAASRARSATRRSSRRPVARSASTSSSATAPGAIRW